MLYSLITKLPIVGNFIEAYQVHQEYKSNVHQIRKNYSHIKLIARDLETKKKSCIYPSSRETLEGTIDSIKHKMHQKNTDISKERRKACGGICLIVLQEIANGLFFGGGAVVNGIASVATSVFGSRDKNYEEVVQTGISTGLTDLACSTIVETALRG